MKLRWFIRGFAVALLVLCLSLWGLSYFCGVTITAPLFYKAYQVEAYPGKVTLTVDNAGGLASGVRWSFKHGHVLGSWTPNADCKRFLGFTYLPSAPGRSFRELGVPFWFPSLLLGGLVWFVWWRLRRSNAIDNVAMVLRWVIRGSAIALLTLCLSLWGWSYFYELSVRNTPYFNGVPWVCDFDMYAGSVFFKLTNNAWGGNEFRFERYPSSWLGLRHAKLFPGFAYHSTRHPIHTIVIERELEVPFWLPSLFLGGLVWFVWRQTRVKREGRGFPVEISR